MEGLPMPRKTAGGDLVTALDLTPKDYLEMLKEEYSEFAENPLSIRKALTCCFFSNALPEVVFKTYETGDKGKVHNAASSGAYRDHLREKESAAHHTVRDLCDFSKHVYVTLRKPMVTQVAHGMRKEGIMQGLLALTREQEIERLLVTFEDGSTQTMQEVLDKALRSWEEIFTRDKL
jgi:hypothetical protein